jgi:hypothetical protein
MQVKILVLWDYQVWDGGDRHNHKAFVEYSDDTYDFDRQVKNSRLTQYDTAFRRDLVICDNMDDLIKYKEGTTKKAVLEKAKKYLTVDELKLLGINT